jgi:ABC-type antimicrobial peptide transport system permease subunit
MTAHKLRSFLTMFGIIWGITSVILLVGLGKGFSRDQKERLKTIGVDLAIVWGGRTSEQAGGYAFTPPHARFACPFRMRTPSKTKGT